MKLSLLPIYSPALTFFILSAVMIFRYFILAMGFQWILRRFSFTPINQSEELKKNVVPDLQWSLVSSLIFAFFGTWMIKLWQAQETLIYENMGQYGWAYFFLSLPLYLFIHDTYFYWTHRLLHKKILRKFHFVHHRSVVPTAWTSFAFHPLEALIQALILPLLILTLPIHWTLLVFFLLLMSLTGVLNHLGYELYPNVLEKKYYFISATHHQIHHSHVNKNFGLYFTFWDKLMGTESYDR